VYRNLTKVENRLSGEVNVESILALDEQIREHETVIAELKRARNSLLNISKLPPELLGNIFRWNVTLKGDFGGLEKESHNFLLVCHHWFKVASSTPELWSFWGNTPKDWARWSHRSGTAPVDLVLDFYEGGGSFDAALCNVLRDHATRDTIRRFHLRACGSNLLSSIISPLTAGPKEHRSISVESLILRDESGGIVDISDFLAHYSFSNLQRLELSNCTVSSWDLITSRTPVLTTLDLYFRGPWLSPTPTASQLLFILASYPILQNVSLSWFGDRDSGDDGDDGGGNPSPRVSLPHLKELKLDGDMHEVFGLLGRLDHPNHMDTLDVTFEQCEIADVSDLVGPYLQDYLRRRGGSQSGLGLSLRVTRGDSIVLHVGDPSGIDFSNPVPARMKTFAEITMDLDRGHPKHILEEAILRLIAYTPQEEIVHFRTYGEPVAMEKISAQLPNLRGLHFEKTPLPAALPKSSLDRKIFPSLQYILLDWVVADHGDWSPLTTFLDWRVSSGNRLHTLVMIGTFRMAPSVQRSLPGVVQEFRC